MDKYGATPDDLAEIPLAQRGSAALNNMAIMRGKPMDRQSYFSEPHMVGPFAAPTTAFPTRARRACC